MVEEQEYSYKDNIDNFYLALTSPTQFERHKNWGKVFQVIGQNIHHIQDMAQPQHTRGDDHCSSKLCTLLMIDKPSLYERYTAKNHDSLEEILKDNPYPPLNLAKFPVARAFWDESIESDGYGLAEFTSHNFC